MPTILFVFRSEFNLKQIHKDACLSQVAMLNVGIYEQWQILDFIFKKINSNHQRKFITIHILQIEKSKLLLNSPIAGCNQL